MSASSYEPKYTSLEEVPVTGPADWTDDTTKRRAIRNAESRLEADVNDGEEIQDPEQSHSFAVALYSTYLLILGGKAPSSMKLGDLSDEGSRNEEFHDHLLAQYHEMIAVIRDAEGDAGDEGGDTPEKRSPYVHIID